MKKTQVIRFFVVPLGIWIFCLALLFCGVFTFLENKTYDNRTVLTSNTVKSSDEICFIAVDQESIDWAQKTKGWSWPWPRSAYGDIINYMNAGGANVVLLDVIYSEPSVYGTADDEYFAKACADYGRTVQVIFGSETQSVVLPIKELQDSAALIANITSATDSDDVIRRARLSYTLNGTEYASLGIAPYVLEQKNQTAKNTSQIIQELKQDLPILSDGTVLLRYKKSIDEYLPYRASDILQSYDSYKQNQEPLISPTNFEGSTVYLAYYAPGLFDICSTPVAQVYPGVGVHITTCDNLLNNSFVKKIPIGISIFYMLLLSFAGTFAIELAQHQKKQKLIPIFTVANTFIGIVFIIALSYILFSLGFWILLIAPLSTFILAFGSQLFLRYVFESRQKKFIKSAFSQYLSPMVIDQLISNPEKLKLGGEKRKISIYFSDVQGFTSISEKLSPETLTEVLNDYLSEMTDIILESGGTIDKYEGDALIAFWNAPADEEDHALRAINAAMKCQKRLEELRPKLAELSGGQMYQRIGLNTGFAVVGNMGSHSRFDYTMLGDSVNLASRLEGLNKQFGTYTMCSKETKDEAVKFGSDLCWRELARVAVVGKKEAVTVFEPMEKTIFEQKKEAIEIFNQGRELFYKGDFEKALELFTSKEKEDSPCKFYAEKCKELLSQKVENWDGVWHSTQK